MSIVVFHLRVWFPGTTLMTEAALAVDFFFLLSGFIVAHAYERRFSEGMSGAEFARLRAIRLYPLIALASMLGLLAEILRPLVRSDAVSPETAVLWATLGLLCLPIAWGAGRAGQFFPLNWPQWSLFFEICVNGAYAVTARRLTPRTLLFIVVAAGCAEIAVTFYFGRIDLGRGWLFLAGLPRAAFPFFLGVLLRRANRAVLPQVPSCLVVALLLATFLPTIPTGHWRAVYELSCVLFVYPMIVLMAVNVEPLRFRRLAILGGDLSYPLYILHFPLLVLLMMGWRAFGLQPGAAGWLWIAAAIAGVVALSYLALELFDRPVRAWLTRLNEVRRVEHY